MPSMPDAMKRRPMRLRICGIVRLLPEARSISPDSPAMLTRTSSQNGISARDC
ncbi:hypothetical protein D3C78_1645330 [compost metagenome]